MKRVFNFSGLLFLTGFCLLGFLYFWSDVLKPELEKEPIYYSPEEIEITENSRDVSFTEDEIFKIQHDVDYSEGKSGRWYPKSESPLFTELVDEGKLPPVAERVGSEPVVLKGVDSIGSYGGTWFQVRGSAAEVSTIEVFYSGSTIVRWSPFGYPIVPHVAKGWEFSPDKREWTFYLRKGMKWSDGHPFTADDILYWWEKDVGLIKGSVKPDWMKIGGTSGNIVKIDDYTVKFVFHHPNGSFLERLARANVFCSPRHYMEKFNPVFGDDALIEATLEERRLPSRNSLITLLKLWNNPEHPRLWPWIYRTYKANPPQVFVRNPYYWAVDTEGNQLPYLDQIYFDARNYKFVPIAAASGAITFKIFDSMDLYYTLLMTQREASDYAVYHWFPATRSRYLIYPNINLWVDPENQVTQMKHDLINDKRFRQALSLAINRQQIIDIVYSGMAEPAQLSPGRESFFHHEKLHKSFTEFAPERANQLLDEIGLTQRDNGGYRTFKDGTRMSWFYDVPEGEDEGPTELIIEDWSRIGIRAIHRKPSLALFGVNERARKLEFSIWPSDTEFIPIAGPQQFVALTSRQAAGYTQWYMNDGHTGNPEATQLGGIEPPIDHPLRRSFDLLEAAYGATTREAQREFLNKIFDIAAENVWSINVNTSPPHPVVVKNGFKNVPRKAAYAGLLYPPSNAGLETFYIEEPDDSPGVVAQIKNELIKISPAPYSQVDDKHESKSINHLARLIKYLFIGVFSCGIIMVGVRHPYIGRRLLIMVPSLLIISIISFAIIQLPPGNFIETRILELQLKGGRVNIEEIKELREIFHLDKPIAQRYAHWLGLYWFTSFENKDQGLLQGHMGLSMENQVPVNEVVGDRILLTFLISLGTILFTWAVAMPIGIYSAVRQYTLSDYLFTLIGFIGMSVPSFLLALILLYWSSEFLGINISGLFSPEYAIQPGWSGGKIVDLMQHIWVPVVVLGVTGTAGMIRVMRGTTSLTS